MLKNFADRLCMFFNLSFGSVAVKRRVYLSEKVVRTMAVTFFSLVVRS